MADGRLSRPLRGLKLAAAAALDLLWPPVCPACGTGLEPGERDPLCARCRLALPLIRGRTCTRCGTPLGPFEDDRDGRNCADCGGMNLVFKRAAAAGVYDGALAEVMKVYKYTARARGAHLAGFLAGLLAETLDSPDCPLAAREAEVLVPVPLHRSRRRARGFDQTAELARKLAPLLGLPLELGLLVKTRATESQMGLARATRLANIKGSFVVRRPERVAGKLVLLLDDVMTTCATAEECARTLRNAGAREVRVAVVCRTVAGRDTGAAAGIA